MRFALRQPMSLPEFLAWEERQELRYEFDGFQPVAMVGGTVAHAFIQRNLAIAVGGRLRGSPCRFAGSDLKIEVVGRIRYPDGFVVCTPVPPRSTVVTDPVVIFEVISPGTAGTDRILKAREYGATPSLQRYVLLEQDRVAATVFSRRDGDWSAHVIVGDEVLAMPEIGIEMPLPELYEGVELPDPDTAPAE